jgi:thiamine biosynthesis lipoprotein
MKRIFPIFLALSLLCGCVPEGKRAGKQYTATFLTLFDTVTTIVGPAESEEAFRKEAQKIHDALEVYHKLFDIYNDYEGIVNLKAVNDSAGGTPVRVDPAIIQLLSDCKTYYELTGGKVNVAMGSVLKLWHDARSDGIRDPREAKLPDSDALKQAAVHTDISCVIVDATASTVQIIDKELRLDVGAVAKGWATQRVAENAPAGMLISVGGNVCATGPKTEDGTPWVIGIQDPKDSSQNCHTLFVTGGCVVTSGDYQRTYTVDGKKYHHIIDPTTRMPGTLWRSVSVVCEDSALADALSTALFLMPLEEGRALAERCGANILWIDSAGEEFMTPGFEKMIRT